MIKIVELIQTCNVCPSQWEGWTDDNRPVYVRFRWGHLWVSIGKPGENIDDAVRAPALFDEQLSDGLDGYLEYAELVTSTPDIITWPDADSVKEDWLA